jgi:estrogen-related receptor beta like 1
VIEVLNCLANYAIKHNNIPTISQINLIETDDERDSIDNQTDIDDLNDLSDHDESEFEFTADEQTFTLIDEVSSDLQLSPSRSSRGDKVSSNRLNPVMQSNISADEWIQQTERLLPQLQTGAAGHGSEERSDWRWRLNEVDRRRQRLSSELDESSGRLSRLHENVQRAVQRLAGRERHVQQQLQGMVDEWSALRVRLRKATEQYQQTNGGVLDKSRKLAELSDRVQRVRSQVDQQAAKLTDGAPLASLRSRVRELRAEIDSFDVRIAVASRSLLQVRVQQAVERSNAQTGSDIMIGKSQDRKFEGAFRATVPRSPTQRSLI